ncbi:DUF2800 domain-containing protein [Paenibacillus flagellatus]|uniref:DUF2800 domain-containing protein n=1 Tax=Paenibacillus flagellatus TaxID=2211139 RepID=A0A2V5KC44_9BACL|nr:DUF2800 domain-containing protein [Paenibacillus flagellatus]PYI57048.1 DUF2800 domain-containing protein [Paenibacillus flagellatus]
MTELAHAERAHSLLGASKASQWINCPPSARLQESVPDTRSEYADEGTLAHELAEIKLRRRLLPCNSAERKRLDDALKVVMANPLYGPEMEGAIQEYYELVEERYMAAKARSADAVILLEEPLDFSEWTAPDQGGTGDVVLIADSVLEVIDLKYGKGVPVSAVGNPQIRLYGLGAWYSYSYLYDIREVHMTIAQPRLDSVSTDVMPIGELLEWAETVVKPAAKLAYAGEGECKPGDHCRWCKVKATCRARADENLKALAHEFQDPALLNNEEIGSILFIAQRLKSWAADVEEYAFEQAKRGVRIPQWKLVAGKSDRKFTDKEAVKARLLDAGYEPEKILKPQVLVAMGDLEKTIVGKKKFTELLGDLIVKPPGKPALVPETDPRPELNSVESDFANIDMEE